MPGLTTKEAMTYVNSEIPLLYIEDHHNENLYYLNNFRNGDIVFLYGNKEGLSHHARKIDEPADESNQCFGFQLRTLNALELLALQAP